MSFVLEAKDLRKEYAGKAAVQGISFGVRSGEIVGLLGPNGAGKTTTINMVLGVLSPTSGHILICGHALARERAKALAQANFAAVYAALPGNLTVAQNLRVFGMLYGVPRLTARIEEVLEMFDLNKYRHTKCGVLSSGEQTRANLAKAMLNRPKLLLLDEPTASLDPATAKTIRAKIRAIAGKDTGVLWTSHNMAEVEEVCDRVLFMAGGRILLEGTPAEIVAERGKASLEELFIHMAEHSDLHPSRLEGQGEGILPIDRGNDCKVHL